MFLVLLACVTLVLHCFSMMSFFSLSFFLAFSFYCFKRLGNLGSNTFFLFFLSLSLTFLLSLCIVLKGLGTLVVILKASGWAPCDNVPVEHMWPGIDQGVPVPLNTSTTACRNTFPID